MIYLGSARVHHGSKNATLHDDILAYQSGERALKIVIKLTKKQNRAFLTFQITENVLLLPIDSRG
jgi:hypothetical protein